MPKETKRLKLPLPLGNENVTLESINGIFEKIDAGVATRESILISAGSDLNTYMEEGNYYCPANATVATLLNSPTAEAFHLTVEAHAGVLQTLSTFQPGDLEVFQRNYYFGWGPWKKVPTRDELEEILPQANGNAQGYANAAVAPIIGEDSSNLVQNSSALLGLYGWASSGTAPWSVYTALSHKTLKYFYVPNAVPAGQLSILTSDIITVFAGDFYLQALFYTLSMDKGDMYIEVLNVATSTMIDSLTATLNANWHRKSKKITIPSGVTQIRLRLVVAGKETGVNASTKAITRIKLSYGSVDVPYTAEGDDLALLGYTNKMRSWGAI
ncbi:pyocin knob domain-containing protein [Paenibacillus pabuli]|uniref:pyocin knob domain-containing protein n=1 Tax=Paenibacillus pabuli TaxID=1472 RepID=UPI001FFFFEDF|nr:pyocin knob domain-containing protein [Paenibacillus pabuli]UPK45207.1 hypothetical protein KET34_06850 [Paenibacillus pabuli]